MNYPRSKKNAPGGNDSLPHYDIMDSQDVVDTGVTSTRDLTNMHLYNLNTGMIALNDSVKELHTKIAVQENTVNRLVKLLEGNGKPGLIAEHHACMDERKRVSEFINNMKQDTMVKSWIKYGAIALISAFMAASGSFIMGRAETNNRIDKICETLEKLEEGR